jgi:hypothetical protein|nr:MAG TPA: hypothetical protein [Caudoviricetes sp.]
MGKVEVIVKVRYISDLKEILNKIQGLKADNPYVIFRIEVEC